MSDLAQENPPPTGNVKFDEMSSLDLMADIFENPSLIDGIEKGGTDTGNQLESEAWCFLFWSLFLSNFTFKIKIVELKNQKLISITGMLKWLCLCVPGQHVFTQKSKCSLGKKENFRSKLQTSFVSNLCKKWLAT